MWLAQSVHWPEKLARIRLPSSWAFLAVTLASAAYTAYIGHFTVLRHRLVQTTAFDLGISS
jgi:hypothetical protein